MAQEESVAGSENERKERDFREYRITGLADLIPDWLLPPDGKQHVRNARKEMLLAVRSVVDQAIQTQERGVRVRHAPAKIEIE